MSSTAIITGLTGQDGSYLAELLADRGYQVHGHTRRCGDDLGHANHLADRITMHRFSPHDQQAWNRLLHEVQPDELYHFAADTFVPNGWENPLENSVVNYGVTLHLLEAIRHFSPKTRLLNACSREIVGDVEEGWVREDTPMNPTTMYGVNKAASRWATQLYIERYGLFVSNAILFNHESPRRGHSFVTRKITLGVASIAANQQQEIELGNLTAQRDWGYAGDFVEGMWRALQIDQPEDFVFGTGNLNSIEQFADLAFSAVGLDWQEHVRSVPMMCRGNEALPVAADISKAKRVLGWTPQTDLEQLVAMMVRHDVSALQQQATIRRRAA